MDNTCKNCLEAKDIGLYTAHFKYLYTLFHKPLFPRTFLIFSIFHGRHIGHVGWDPNTGFDVSILLSCISYDSEYMGMLWLILGFLFTVFKILFIRI